jgi:hypothetical protein
MATPTTSDHDQTRIEAPKAKTDTPSGPDFDSMTDRELLMSAASNAFHNGKALRQIKIMATVLGLLVSLVLIKIFGLT